MTSYLDIARQYHAAGLKVIPFYKGADGKVQFPTGYADYRAGQTAEDIDRLFSRQASGIALLCTDDIEAIDIDTKHDDTGELDKDFFMYAKMYEASREALDQCVIQKTKSGGWHVIYRTDTPEGNQKLAVRPANDTEKADSQNLKQVTLIETRGTGGLLFIAPTPGYEVKRGDLRSIPRISTKARRNLLECARVLSQPIPDTLRPAAVPSTPVNGHAPGDQRPGDAFDEVADMQAILEHNGWTEVGTVGGYTRMNRPGAKHSRGIDGVIIRQAGKPDLFYPWSQNTAFPEAERCYSAFAVYTIYQHGGDYQAAAKDLYQQGFGSRMNGHANATLAPHAPMMSAEEVRQRVEAQAAQVADLVTRVRATRFDYHEPITEDAACLTLSMNGKQYKVGGPGMLGAIVGEQKSGKSLLSQCLVASALSGAAPRLGFSLDLSGNMEFYDTEQSEFFYKLSQRRIHQLAGITDNLDRYAAYHLRGFSRRERMAAMTEMLQGRKLDLLVIDGIVDLCDDFMDAKASEATIEQLMRWSSETGAMVIAVLHLTKGQGFMRGHLGTALQNKCDFALEVKRDKELGFFQVICRESRFAPFSPFSFTRDEYGMPVLETENYSSSSFPVRRRATTEEENAPF